MHPILFRFPSSGYEISSFGVLMMLGFFVAFWLTVRELPHKSIDPRLGYGLFLFIMIGGVLGSKLYFATDMALRTGRPWSGFFFQIGGITWYGGLLGGILAGSVACRIYGIELRRLLEASAVAVPIGQALGRVGCFLAGDDYGTPSDLPWALAFPQGSPPVHVPVHPTQLYEIAWLLSVALILYSRRQKSPFLFGEYLAANGLGRLFIEHLRINPRVALGLTEPQWIGIALIAIGAASWFYYRAEDERSAAQRRPDQR
jgi:phosphatidylglycerol:prolipoprotein diacylglycerol transferase